MKNHQFKNKLLISMLSLIGLGSFFFGNPVLAANCTMTGVNGNTTTITSGQSLLFYSTVLRTITGQNYANGCAPYSGMLSCHNGIIQGGITTFKYTLNECTNTLLPKNCIGQRAGGIITHNVPVTGYSAQLATFPQSCNDFATTLSCMNGLLNGNATTYQYSTCTEQGRPTQPVDLELKIQTPTAPDTIKVAQYSSPQLNISINNIGYAALSGSFTEGFLQCDWNNGINVYKSRPLVQFVANPMIPQSKSITLKDIFTQSLGKKQVTCRLNKSAEYYTNETAMTNNVRSGDIEVVTAARFDIAMERAIQPIKNNLDAPEITSAEGGAATIREFVYKKVMDILVPLIVVIGILSAILGFYKMFFSTDDTATQEGVKYIAYGLIGIIIIMSAKFIGNSLTGLLPEGGEITGTIMAQGIYNNIVYPFVKLGMYLVLGVMFIILVGRTLTFLFGSDDEAKKKAGTIIGRNIIAMIVIIGAKQIVEAIYGKVNQVTKDVSNLGEIGSSILADKNIPILYEIINRIMGLTSLVVLIIIIFQTFQLLMKPDSPEQMTSLKNSLIYVLIGLIIIGAGYLITNFLIIS